MQLSEEELNAIEQLRLRPGESYWAEKTLADAMLRLFPPGYFDQITPERLVELGGVLSQMSEVVCFESCAEFWFSGCDIRQLHVYDKHRTTWIRIPSHLHPRNMGEVLELVARCKEGQNG